ncbi:hypothetical protein Q7F20_13995 [Curtobacterium sp. A7_M15]|uniref:hypothetical protein n=1 Tax=Curtobacterium sp. A7_M15 TaxID=3065241 RepID=UPI002737ACAE|nr:hypothetical protein [Curtobacterium sp. A7_M15]MDP4334488.1 hypothetical protein [Curtobacterium sp. A7_M15]
MASHRLPDEDRPRRAVPDWVTAPPEGPADDLEARPTAAAPAPAPETAGPGSTLPAQPPTPGRVDDDIVVPDFPPEDHLLPPAPTSPAVHTLPVDTASVGRAPIGSAPVGSAPVSPIDAVGTAPVVPAAPGVPAVGQPRFSVPGLEHVVVEGAEPAPSGPIGYRTPARFAHQRPAAPTPAAPAPAPAFEAVVAPPAPATPDPRGDALPPTEAIPLIDLPTRDTAGGSGGGTGARSTKRGPHRPGRGRTTGRRAPKSTRGSAASTANDAATAVEATTPGRTVRGQGEPRLQAAAPAPQLVGTTPAAVLGAVAGVATLGLGAWWFTAPATVHGVGLVLGVLALLLSIVTLRRPGVTWQRPLALLGAVLGGVGTLVLVWAVASALLPLVGVTVPDLTGTGTVPTLAP